MTLDPRDPIDRDPLATRDPVRPENHVHVEERGSSMMPILIGALVVVAGIIAFMMYGGNDTDTMTTGTVDRPAPTAPANPAPAAPPTVPAPSGPAGSPAPAPAPMTPPAQQ